MNIFNFESKEIRTVVKDAEVYFVAKDVADILGYKNQAEAIKDHCKGVQTIKGSEMLVASDYATCVASGYSHNDAIRKWQIIPERDVYRLIMRSKLPSAEKFEEWVVGTVLPTIRKTGGYIQGEEHIESEDELIFRAMEVLQKKIAVMKPKADYHDTWMSASGSYTTTEVAKKLGISAIKLNRFLRSEGIKFKRKDLPVSGYEEWFKLVDRTIQDHFGNAVVTTQCKVSPEGVRNIIELYQSKH